MAIAEDSSAINMERDDEFLNAYDIGNVEDLQWNVRKYSILPSGTTEPNHNSRGTIKDVAWQLYRCHRNLCKGEHYFVIDISESEIIVPETWELPDQLDFEEFHVTHLQDLEVRADIPSHKKMVAGILRESIKRHFRNEISFELGDLWRDYGDYCQTPAFSKTEGGYFFCRKFKVSPEYLCNGRWVVQIEVTTTTVDGRSLADYYHSGEVQQLAEMIRLKRVNRLTRKNEPTAVRVLYEDASAGEIEVLELESPADITEAHALLSPADQQKLANEEIRCLKFNKPPLEVQLDKVRLILDTHITRENHGETLIDPEERAHWYQKTRDFLHGLVAFGQQICLAKQPIRTAEFKTVRVLPPAVHVRSSNAGTRTIPAPAAFTSNSLRDRLRKRHNAVRKFGYLEQRPINPLLVYPQKFENNRANRMQRDLNWIVKQQGLTFQFRSPICYKSIQDLEKLVQRFEPDALLVVLPEGSWEPYKDTDTHEKIKKQIPIPTQCIHHDNTLSERWVDRPWRAIKESDFRYSRRITDKYQQCILNLLVKHHWIPFAPADSFAYNVHVGIDVGGRHNTHVMACIGHGFAHPERLVFLPGQINIDTQQAEPIFEDQLYSGLLSIFENLHSRLAEAGLKADFDKTLFFRDGEFRGQGDAWNEVNYIPAESR